MSQAETMKEFIWFLFWLFVFISWSLRSQYLKEKADEKVKRTTR